MFKIIRTKRLKKIESELKHLRRCQISHRKTVFNILNVIDDLDEKINNLEVNSEEEKLIVAAPEMLEDEVEYKTFCEWEKDKDYIDICYNSGCGEIHSFENGNIKDNGFIYCPYCGKLIVEIVE